MTEPPLPWLRSRRRAAAILLIAGLATLLAYWGLGQRGDEALQACRPGAQLDLRKLLPQLEAQRDAAGLMAVLRADDCNRPVARELLHADFVLLPCYGGFIVAMFVLLANLRIRGRWTWWAWVVGGAVLAGIAVAADAVENVRMLRLLSPGVAPQEVPALLAGARLATAVKWGAIVAATLAAAALWTRRPLPPDAVADPRGARLAAEHGVLATALRWLVALLGVAAAVGLTLTVLLPGAGLSPRGLELARWGFTLLLAYWACAFARAVAVAIEPPSRVPVEAVSPEAGPAVSCAPPPGVAPEVGSAFERAYPRPLFDREWRETCRRREKIGLPADGPRVGIGISGGGIRSATLDLGIFQGISDLSLAPDAPPERRVLERLDYVSTVSGGGYFGSFLGRLWTRRFIRGPRDVAATLLGRGENGRNVMRYLRENGRFLAPSGAGDLLLGGAVALRNWVAIQLVLVTFLLTLFIGLQAFRPWLDQALTVNAPSAPAGAALRPIACLFELAGSSFWWSPWLLLPLLCFALFAFPLGWAYWMVEPLKLAGDKEGKPLPRRAAFWDRSAIAPVAGLILTLVVAVVMACSARRTTPRVLWAVVALTAVLTFVAWWLARREARQTRFDGTVGPGRVIPPGASGELDTAERELEERIRRHSAERGWLSTRLAEALLVTGVLLALGLIDSAGQSLYVALLGDDLWSGWLAGVFSGLGILVANAQRIALFFSRGSGKDERPSLPINLLAGAAAFVLVTLLLVCLNAASHAVAWRAGDPVGSVRWQQRQQNCPPAALPADCTPAALARRDCGEGTAGTPHRERRDVVLSAIALLTGFVLSLFFGQTFPFVNRSSHQTLYSSRLTRAYLGASNWRRWTEAMTRVIRGDDVDLMRYFPPPTDKSAPLHLINVTLNETVSGRSQVEQKDRKGFNLALGPHGFSVGVEHHAIVPLGRLDPFGQPVTVYPQEEEEFRIFEYPRVGGQRVFTGESLSLGEWVGVSGAAFSTGLGARTSLGLSLLTGFGNVRLGRWWDSGAAVEERQGAVRPSGLIRLEHAAARVFPVQVFLLDEFLARFHGPARRHWYLSDGGHFENMAGYELIRRRLPMIVIIDAEQDGEFTFGGLSNLVRKARIDFGSEVRFLDAADLGREMDPSLRDVIGPLEELRRGAWERVREASDDDPAERWRLVEADPSGLSRVHAAVARVTHENGTRSRLLYIKATLTGDESVDLLEYHRAHPAFPHEPTTDQFFDEAQWESYRKLGEHIALKLFRRPAGAAAMPPDLRWWPDELGDQA